MRTLVATFWLVVLTVGVACLFQLRRRDMAKVSEELADLRQRFDTATTNVGNRIRDAVTRMETALRERDAALADAPAIQTELAGLRAEADGLEQMGSTPDDVPGVTPDNTPPDNTPPTSGGGADGGVIS